MELKPYGPSGGAGHAEAGYGVVVNPTKSLPIVFREGDQLIVLAEE